MKLIDIFVAASGLPASAIEAIFERIATAAPDLRDEADAALKALREPLSGENLAAVAAMAAGELASFLKTFKLDPRQSPSNII